MILQVLLDAMAMSVLLMMIVDLKKRVLVLDAEIHALALVEVILSTMLTSSLTIFNDNKSIQ